MDLSLTSPRPGTVSISCPTQLVESPSYASFSGHPLVVQRLNAGEDVDSITADVKARAARAAERLQGNSDEILTTLLVRWTRSDGLGVTDTELLRDTGSIRGSMDASVPGLS